MTPLAYKLQTSANLSNPSNNSLRILTNSCAVQPEDNLVNAIENSND